MTDKVNELAGHVEDALLSVDELLSDPGSLKTADIAIAKDALEKAKDAVDEMQEMEGDAEAP